MKFKHFITFCILQVDRVYKKIHANFKIVNFFPDDRLVFEIRVYYAIRNELKTNSIKDESRKSCNI